MTFRRDDIERVRTAINLVELVQTVTTVRRSGRSYMAICPFHQEKTPSLSLDPAKAVWYCHGCHQGGDVFKFLMDTKGLDFNEADRGTRFPGWDHAGAGPGRDDDVGAIATGWSRR